MTSLIPSVENTATVSITKMNNSELIEFVKEEYKRGTEVKIEMLLMSLDTQQLTQEHRREICKFYEISQRDLDQILRQQQQFNSIQHSLGEYPKDEYHYVELQLTQWRTQMTFNGEFTLDTAYDIGDGTLVTKQALQELDLETRTRILLMDPKVLNMSRMLDKLRYSQRKLKLNYKDREIEHALNWWVQRHRDELTSHKVSELVYHGAERSLATEAEWDKYISAITMTNQLATKTVIKHWIWQVKRKMFNLPVKYHMMLVFYGKQAAGKSTMVKELNEPVKDFMASTNFANITDSRSHGIWQNYVLFFDEMGRSTTSNLEDIKRIITEDSFTSRIMHSNTDTVIKNQATCIGTCNKDLSRMIFDDTGMRRFFQIDCPERIDWAVTSKINFKRLWQSVDENAETPLLADPELLAEIQRVQNAKRHITMMEKWLRERAHQQFVEETVNAQAFYEQYVEYERKNNNNRCDTSNTKFGRDIKDIAQLVSGLTLEHKRKSKGYVYILTYTQSTDLD